MAADSRGDTHANECGINTSYDARWAAGKPRAILAFGAIHLNEILTTSPHFQTTSDISIQVGIYARVRTHASTTIPVCRVCVL